MRDYGKVRTAIWSDEKVREDMTSDDRVLFFYLLTSPHTTALGCFYCPDGYILEDLRWSLERVKDTIASLCRLGVAHRDRTGWVWLPNFLRHNVPENGSVWKHIRRLAKAIPESVTFRAAVIASIPDSDTVPPTVPTLVPEPPPEPEPNPTEPEPNPTQPSKRGADAPPPSRRRQGTKLPEGWQPSDDDVAYAMAHGFGVRGIHAARDGEAMLADFLEHFGTGKGRNETSADWSLRWKRWVRTQAKWRDERKGSSDATTRISASRPDRPRTVAEALARKDRAELEALAETDRDAGDGASSPWIDGRAGSGAGGGVRQIAGGEVRRLAQVAGGAEIGSAVRSDAAMGEVPAADADLRSDGPGARAQDGPPSRVMEVAGREAGAARIAHPLVSEQPPALKRA